MPPKRSVDPQNSSNAIKNVLPFEDQESIFYNQTASGPSLQLKKARSPTSSLNDGVRGWDRFLGQDFNYLKYTYIRTHTHTHI